MATRRMLWRRRAKPKFQLLDEDGTLLARFTISREKYDEIMEKAEKLGSTEAAVESMLIEHVKRIKSHSN